MALTLVQNKVCPACEADVRPNALFCYSCGAAVSVKEKFDENSTREQSIQTVVQRDEKIAAPEINNAEGVEKPTVAEAVKLKSAAALRRKSKSFQSKPVEIVWEEHENAPNGWFISVAVFLTIVAGVILLLAVRLK